MERDLLLARELQAEFDSEARSGGGRSAQLSSQDEASLELARRLQRQFETESASVEMAPFLPPEYRTPSKARPANSRPVSCVSEEWETIDPTPDLHALFLEFNQTFFWGKLVMCEVRWSPRMYTCAGICRYSPRERFCTIGISIPLLKLRPRKDLVETLLHEMIHAYLFITDNNDNHDGHGPEFHKHMYRINAATGANISVYHTFHDEVELYKQHWWRCDGPCTQRPPFYGFVKRTMNRAPGPRDRWWSQHSQSCGGNFVKVKEPDGFGKKGKKGGDQKSKTDKTDKTEGPDIRKFFGGNNKENNKDAGNSSRVKGLLDANVLPKINTGVKANVKGFNPSSSSGGVGGAGVSRSEGGPGVSGGGGRGNIFGFGGTSFSGVSGTKTGKKTGTIVVRPGQRGVQDNSRGGEAITTTTSPTPSLSTGPGQKLGGGGSSSGGGGGRGVSARDAVRSRWSQAGSKAVPPVKKTEEVVVESESVSCPVCSRNFSPSAINSHLDSCLATPEQEEKDEVEDSLNDGEDEALLAAVIEFEKSTNASSSSASAIVLSDSDDSDDEPLVKRRSGERFNDVMADQDDQDILAALETSKVSEEEAEQSMFACPICDELLHHKIMFSHLDTCTKNI